MTIFKLKFALAIMLLTGLGMQSSVKAQQDVKSPNAKMRIGTFDSRCVAIAYYRSKEFKQKMKELHTQHQDLKSAGDMEGAEELEKKGIALQAMVHKQGFGTWPINAVLEKIKGQLPEIASQADVDVIVSKWNFAFQRPGSEFTNVTELMVKPFNPSDQTLKIIRDIQNQPPVPIEKLNDH